MKIIDALSGQDFQKIINRQQEKANFVLVLLFNQENRFPRGFLLKRVRKIFYKTIHTYVGVHLGCKVTPQESTVGKIFQ